MAFGGLALYAALAGTGLTASAVRTVAVTAALVVAAAVPLTVGFVRRGERTPWLVLGLAATAYAVAAMVYMLHPEVASDFPSAVDLSAIAFYPLAMGSLVFLVHARLPQFPAVLWLDAAVGALVCAAIGAAALDPVLGSEPSLVVTGRLLYALGDLLLFGFAATAYLLSGRGMERSCMLLVALGADLLAVVDGVYVVDVAHGVSAPTLLVTVCWPAGMLCLAGAALSKVKPVKSDWTEGSPLALVPTIGGAVCLPITIFYTLDSAPAVVLSASGLALLLVRLSLSRAQNLRLLREARRAEVELRDYAEQLQGLSTRDLLTGVLNYAGFHEALARELERCKRYGGRFSVVMLDLDGFKGLNDSAGHAEGDRVLDQVAQTLTSGCRPSDLVARLGSDEFALLMPESGREQAVTAAERIKHGVDALDPRVGISFGVAEWPADGPDKQALLFCADMALYAAKPVPSERRRVAAASRLALSLGERESRLSADQASAALSQHDQHVRRMLSVARDELGMDVAYVSEFTDTQQVFRDMLGDGESFGLHKDARMALEESYCKKMVHGDIPNVIGDATRDERIRSMTATRPSDLGAYVGVPVRFTNGRLYGTLCCASHIRRLDLDERDVAFMHLLARLLADQLEQATLQAENRRLDAEARSADALMAALDARDHYTGEHSVYVVKLASRVAGRLGLTPDESEHVKQAAILHDIGKIGMPDAILQKPQALDEAEWRRMHEHPAIGAQIVGSLPALSHLAPVIRAEHERWDGNGYPDGLRGEAIPLPSRVVFACDAYHAMTSDRPYRAAMSASDARAELAREAASQFDPAIVKALLDVLQPDSAEVPLPDRQHMRAIAAQ